MLKNCWHANEAFFRNPSKQHKQITHMYLKIDPIFPATATITYPNKLLYNKFILIKSTVIIFLILWDCWIRTHIFVDILVAKNCPFPKESKKLIGFLIPNLHSKTQRYFVAAAVLNKRRPRFSLLPIPQFVDDCTSNSGMQSYWGQQPIAATIARIELVLRAWIYSLPSDDKVENYSFKFQACKCCTQAKPSGHAPTARIQIKQGCCSPWRTRWHLQIRIIRNTRSSFTAGCPIF